LNSTDFKMYNIVLQCWDMVLFHQNLCYVILGYALYMSYVLYVVYVLYAPPHADLPIISTIQSVYYICLLYLSEPVITTSTSVLATTLTICINVMNITILISTSSAQKCFEEHQNILPSTSSNPDHMYYERWRSVESNR